MFSSTCLKDERPAGASFKSSFRRMLNMVSWSSFLTHFIRDLEQNSFWNESHPNIMKVQSPAMGVLIWEESWNHGCIKTPMARN